MNKFNIASIAESAIRENIENLRKYVLERTWFEDWLQEDLARRIGDSDPSLSVEREHFYPTTQERCDIWVDDDSDQESWIELKCCVTNYAQSITESSTNRPITQQISEILRDIQKLKRLGSIGHRYALFVAYPMPNDYKSNGYWAKHLARLCDSASDVSELFAVPLSTTGGRVFFVGYGCRP
jgi:hypothetical protein